jgi:hypothetical protein
MDVIEKDEQKVGKYDNEIYAIDSEARARK